jgi:Excalibur calcium-binding domain
MRRLVLAAPVLLIALAACSSSNETSDAAATSVAPATTAAPAATSPTTEPPITTVAPVPTAAPTPAPTTILETTTTVAPLSVEEVHSALAPVVAAWAAAPSGSSYDAIAATARSLLDSGRSISNVPGTPQGTTSELLGQLSTYPGSDAQVVGALSALGPAGVTVTLPTPTTQPPRFVDTGSDPRFGTCREAKSNGYGPYHRGDAEYGWYDDRDGDGVVCE